MNIFITSGGFVGGYLKKRFKNSLCENIEQADVVINTVGILKENRHTYEDSHIKTVKNLLPRLKNKKFIHISALGSKLNHPSGYKHTKAVAEEIIKQNLTNYAIIKPSIIMGEGQKLYDELEKFKNVPVVLAPKMTVSPVEIEKLYELIAKIINDDLRGEFELCGKRKKMKTLFEEVFKKFGKKTLVIEMPKIFFALFLPVLSALGIMTKDEYLMIEDNVCKEKNG